GAFRYRRCLVPMSGFYEWTGEKGAKIPFAIALKNRRWFCMAGLWDQAMIDGSHIESFTILTTTPNDVMAGLHTRMPVILDPSQYARWLDPGSGPVEDLFEPCPAEDMHAWPIGPAVGNVRNNSPDLIAEV
ncbi:MAG: SOS response-associated peptidase, partial [Pseudomonadota bacterium]